MLVNVAQRRPGTGFARRPLDSVCAYHLEKWLWRALHLYAILYTV